MTEHGPSPFEIRSMRPDEKAAVAQLIFESTNGWYESHGHGKIFAGEPADCLLFCDVYEDLDPGSCLLAVSPENNAILASCFYHPRESHASLGIMNVAPAAFGAGAAKTLLRRVIALAKEADKPLRLVSSALNLDSFSLYTRHGFAPYAFYQDMFIEGPVAERDLNPPNGLRLRDATLEDLDAVKRLEAEIWNTSRIKDWRYFIENKRGPWSVSIAGNSEGELFGVLASLDHPGAAMLGPGLVKEADIAAALIHRERGRYRDRTPVFLIPSDNRALAQAMYAAGARNCELHVAQCLGQPPKIDGIVMPTFMPETG